MDGEHISYLGLSLFVPLLVVSRQGALFLPSHLTMLCSQFFGVTGRGAHHNFGVLFIIASCLSIVATAYNFHKEWQSLDPEEKVQRTRVCGHKPNTGIPAIRESCSY